MLLEEWKKKENGSNTLYQKSPAWIPPATRNSLPQKAACWDQEVHRPCVEHKWQEALHRAAGPWSPGSRACGVALSDPTRLSGSVPLRPGCPSFLGFCKVGLTIPLLTGCWKSQWEHVCKLYHRAGAQERLIMVITLIIVLSHTGPDKRVILSFSSLSSLGHYPLIQTLPELSSFPYYLHNFSRPLVSTTMILMLSWTSQVPWTLTASKHECRWNHRLEAQPLFFLIT